MCEPLAGGPATVSSLLSEAQRWSILSGVVLSSLSSHIAWAHERVWDMLLSMARF